MTGGSADELLRTGDVSAQLRVTIKTLAAWRKRGIGPAWQYLGPRLVVYRRSDVDAWVEQQRQRRAS